jgi:hypothetical protein
MGVKQSLLVSDFVQYQMKDKVFLLILQLKMGVVNTIGKKNIKCK